MTFLPTYSLLVIKPTLELQLKAYQELGLDELARDTQRIIALNFGDQS